MPRDPDERAQRIGADLDKCLRRGLDADDAAVVEGQAVAIVQMHGARHVEQHAVAAGGVEHHPPPRTQVVIEPQDIARALGIPAYDADDPAHPPVSLNPDNTAGRAAPRTPARPLATTPPRAPHTFRHPPHFPPPPLSP